MTICKDCDGRGFNYSDPDGKQLCCNVCDGWGELTDEDELTDEAIMLMAREQGVDIDEDKLFEEFRERNR